MRSHEDNAKFCCVFSAIALSYAALFRRKQGMVENFDYLGDFAKKIENVSYTVSGIY
jgi:hypothetical protein